MSVATASSWRGPFAKRRAVIPAAGYHEWLPTQAADGKPFKQPYCIHPAGGLLSFAGLYELWPDPAKEEDNPDRWLWSATIITHHATWLAGVMNDRTPVILPPDRIDAWLDPQACCRRAECAAGIPGLSPLAGGCGRLQAADMAEHGREAARRRAGRRQAVRGPGRRPAPMGSGRNEAIVDATGETVPD